MNGSGEDAGVVYCEMQARENTSSDRTHFTLTQHMYPGHCGYRVGAVLCMHHVVKGGRICSLKLVGVWRTSGQAVPTRR